MASAIRRRIWSTRWRTATWCRRQVGTFFENVDMLVTPTIMRLPAPLGEVNQNREGMTAMEWTQQIFSYVSFTPLFNTTGQPAISLPLHWSASGVPIGVQIAGR